MRNPHVAEPLRSIVNDATPYVTAPSGSLPTSWAADLTDEINNRWQLGLSDGEARQLAGLIFRRAIRGLGVTS